MTPSRRHFLMGAAALSAAVATPEMVRAAIAQEAAAPWALATADLETDVAPRVLRLVHGRAPAGCRVLRRPRVALLGDLNRSRAGWIVQLVGPPK